MVISLVSTLNESFCPEINFQIKQYTLKKTNFVPAPEFWRLSRDQAPRAPWDHPSLLFLWIHAHHTYPIVATPCPLFFESGRFLCLRISNKSSEPRGKVENRLLQCSAFARQSDLVGDVSLFQFVAFYAK